MSSKNAIVLCSAGLFLSLVAAVPAEQASVPPSGALPAPIPVTLEFVGVTTARLTGSDHGPLGLAQACQAQFSRSHVCSSTDILQSGRTPAFPQGVDSAWVSPSIVHIIQLPDRGSNDNLYILVDASGFTRQIDLDHGDLQEGMNCEQWQSGGLGLTVGSPSGTFQLRDCFEQRPVACCVGRAATR